MTVHFCELRKIVRVITFENGTFTAIWTAILYNGVDEFVGHFFCKSTKDISTLKI